MEGQADGVFWTRDIEEPSLHRIRRCGSAEASGRQGLQTTRSSSRHIPRTAMLTNEHN
jgi:hypothetical protein